jgi:hypothetical protein
MRGSSPIRLNTGLVGRLAVVGLALNWVWEMAQMSAYADMAGRPWISTAWRCLRASVGDVALTIVTVCVSVWLARRPPWVYVTAGAVGSLIALLVEWTALSVGAWAYNERMPIVPIIDVGLWPLLQLTLLVPAALWAAMRICGQLT